MWQQTSGRVSNELLPFALILYLFVLCRNLPVSTSTEVGMMSRRHQRSYWAVQVGYGIWVRCHWSICLWKSKFDSMFSISWICQTLKLNQSTWHLSQSPAGREHTSRKLEAKLDFIPADQSDLIWLCLTLLEQIWQVFQWKSSISSVLWENDVIQYLILNQK